MLLCSTLTSGRVIAENTITVTVDGQPVQNSVQSISFHDDDAILTFTNEATQSVDMSKLAISFEYQEETAITSIKDETQQTTHIYTLDGRAINTTMNKLPKGIYIVNGKKVFIK